LVRVNGPTITRLGDADALSLAAAERWAEIAVESVGQRGRFLVALAGGATPLALYARLAGPPYAEDLPWASTHVFWGDERCVPPGDPESNAGQARRVLLDHVSVPAGNIHRVRGELGPAEAASDYVRQLRALADTDLAWPRFDLVLLGLGADGHTASLFPGPLPLDEPVAPAVPVTALYGGRPAQRVTLTARVLNTARTVLFLVTGEEKAAILATVLAGPHDPERWPAQRIHPSAGSVLWMVDAAAARRLPATPSA
jgi:6-phosphogluconolactonase